MRLARWMLYARLLTGSLNESRIDQKGKKKEKDAFLPWVSDLRSWKFSFSYSVCALGGFAPDEYAVSKYKCAVFEFAVFKYKCAVFKCAVFKCEYAVFGCAVFEFAVSDSQVPSIKYMELTYSGTRPSPEALVIGPTSPNPHIRAWDLRIQPCDCPVCRFRIITAV